MRAQLQKRPGTKTASLRERGFTLIELLVVITIISLLAGISFYSVAEARNKADNARTTAQTRNFIGVIEAFHASTGEYPLTSGIVCLGGSDCGKDASAVLNAELEKNTPTDSNPMKVKLAFNTNNDPSYRAWYARCHDVSGYCKGDDIAEVVWYLKGTTADCGANTSRFISETEGNTACVYKLSGIGTAVNQAALGYVDGGGTPEYCEDAGACNYGSEGSCDYSCIEQCTEPSACNYGASESCDYSCLCGDSAACNYSGIESGYYDSCDYTCFDQCGDSGACNYGANESCDYSSCCLDTTACNYQGSDPYCDYSTCTSYCQDYSACNYGNEGECDYSSCTVTYCEDYSACNYGNEGDCEYYSCTIEYCWDGSACNYGSEGSCDYSCQEQCWDGSACNYGSMGSCDYSCNVSYCEDYGACNYGSEGDCDYSCFTYDYCDDSSACNYGNNESCDYSCTCSYDGSACNYNPNGSGDCDYSCQE